MYIDLICQAIACISRLFQMNFQILSSIAIEWKTIFGQTGMKIFWYPMTANGYFDCEPWAHFVVRVYTTCKIENNLSRPVHPFKQTKHGWRWQGTSFFQNGFINKRILVSLTLHCSPFRNGEMCQLPPTRSIFYPNDRVLYLDLSWLSVHI